MNKLAVLATSVAVSLATWLAPAPAHAFPGDAITLSVSNFTKVAGACVYHPYTATLAFGPSTDEIWLELRVTGPQNEYVGSAFETIDSPGSVTLDVLICSQPRSRRDLHHLRRGDGLGLLVQRFSGCDNTGAVPGVEPASAAPTTTSTAATSTAEPGCLGPSSQARKLRYPRKFGITWTKETSSGYQQGAGYTWKVLINGKKVKQLVQGAGESKYWTSKKLPVGKVQKLVIKGNGEVRYKGKMTPK